MSLKTSAMTVERELILPGRSGRRCHDLSAGHEVQEVTHGFHLLIGAGVEHDQLMSDQVAVTGSVSTGDGHSRVRA